MPMPTWMLGKPITVEQYSALMAQGAPAAGSAAAVYVGDLGVRVSRHVGADRDKLRTFAVANGCWDDRYGALPNQGLVHMSVVNRLRAKVRKGHTISWT
jgi:hypothetical protein